MNIGLALHQQPTQRTKPANRIQPVTLLGVVLSSSPSNRYSFGLHAMLNTSVHFVPMMARLAWWACHLFLILMDCAHAHIHVADSLNLSYGRDMLGGFDGSL